MKRLLRVFLFFLKYERGVVLLEVFFWLVCCFGIGLYKLFIEFFWNKEIFELRNNKRIIFFYKLFNLSIYFFIVFYLNDFGYWD